MLIFLVFKQSFFKIMFCFLFLKENLLLDIIKVNQTKLLIVKSYDVCAFEFSFINAVCEQIFINWNFYVELNN